MLAQEPYRWVPANMKVESQNRRDRHGVSHYFLRFRELVRRTKTQPLETLSDAPDIFRVYRELLQQPSAKRKPGGWEYKGKFYPDYLTVGGACHAIFREALKYCKGSGIDIGAGLWPLPGAIPVDTWRGPGATTNIDEIPAESQDFVFSSHCLEHNADWEEKLREWISKVKHAGNVFLYLPHPDCGIWEVGSPFVGGDHKWTPTPAIVRKALEQNHCKVIARDDGPDAMYSFWVCAQREVN
jgi:SAM-dependent methyltransferase